MGQRETKMATSNEELIMNSLFAPGNAPRRELCESFLDDLFQEFNGKASARWTVEYDETSPDDPRMRAFPLLHYVEVNTPERIIRLYPYEMSAMTILVINDILRDELECMK